MFVSGHHEAAQDFDVTTLSDNVRTAPVEFEILLPVQLRMVR